MKYTASAPATVGHAPAPAPDGATRSSAASISARSGVGPSTRPSAVVASATSPPEDADSSRRASAIARVHRVSPPRVRASIDHDESSTSTSRPPPTPVALTARDGRANASASAMAMTAVMTSDTARRIRSQSVRSRLSLSTWPQRSSDGTSRRRGRTLSRKRYAASPAAPAISTHAFHAARAPNVTPGTALVETPAARSPRGASVRGDRAAGVSTRAVPGVTFGALAAWQAWVLIAGAAGLAAYLFLLKVRPRRLLVPSLLLWGQVLNDKRERTLWERIRRAVSLVITAVIAIALALAFARPSRAVSATGVGGGRLVLVLDSSWSMLARTRGGDTRWTRAIAEARRLLSASSGGEVALATTADGLVEGPTPDLALIEAALDRVAPSGAGARAGALPTVAGAEAL